MSSGSGDAVTGSGAAGIQGFQGPLDSLPGQP